MILKPLPKYFNAFEWYERRLTGLGNRFINELKMALTKIIKNPLAYTRLKKNSAIRKINLFHFPFKIFYDPSTSPIRIVAVIHSSRSSKYTRQRIK